MRIEPTVIRRGRWQRLGIETICVFSVFLFAHCGSLGPGFVNLLDPNGTSGLANLDNAPGHVVVAFANNAEVDERLLLYLESAGGLILSDAEKRSLRPRIRFRAQVTYTDGQTATVEFVDGSTNLVQATFNTDSEPDLNQNNLTNVVVLCDVARVDVVPPIEVFVPVEVQGFEFEEPTDTTPGFFRPSTRDLPQFQELLVDDVDEDLNTLLRRNIGVRDGPAPVLNPLCGSLVTIVLDGVLSVPFREDQGGVPGFDIDDPEAEASIGGRYEFRVSVQ